MIDSPAPFFLIGVSFWLLLKAMIAQIEGGLMARILGDIVSGPGDQDKVIKENAKQIAKNIKGVHLQRLLHQKHDCPHPASDASGTPGQCHDDLCLHGPQSPCII